MEVRRRKPSLLTSLVLSMAFRMATFSFSRADRTLTYSPRCGAKYSGRGKKEDPFSTIQHTRWREQFTTPGTKTKRSIAKIYEWPVLLIYVRGVCRLIFVIIESEQQSPSASQLVRVRKMDYLRVCRCPGC